jgi:sulfatase maturation enzyme AslB (radical SAM superfamily)
MRGLSQRIAKHARLNWQNLAFPDVPSPPFLILFINSLCNMKCEHCFYWQQLNQRDDLTFEEIVSLSENLGPIENLNLSGGEPFLRKEFAEICRQFIKKNTVKEIYVPTNGYFADRTIKAIRGVLEEPGLALFAVELSLDGMPAFHDEFRKTRNSFRKAMETYDALVELQNEDPRLQIHAISTATQLNMAEIRKLTTFLYDRCPRMMHHNLAIIRGDRKNPTEPMVRAIPVRIPSRFRRDTDRGWVGPIGRHSGGRCDNVPSNVAKPNRTSCRSGCATAGWPCL